MNNIQLQVYDYSDRSSSTRRRLSRLPQINLLGKSRCYFFGVILWNVAYTSTNYFALFTKGAKLNFLEEPENGIHPRAIEIVMQSLSSVYDSQVWVSTHSPIVLAHTDLKSVIVMRGSKENGAEAVAANEHPRLKGWKLGIDIGSLFVAGVLG